MSVRAKLSEADLQSIVLKAGGHNTRAQGMCFNEAAAYFAGQPHSDSPPCVCPVIRRFTMRLNDRIEDDAERTALLRPLIPIVVGTKASHAVEIKHAYMAMDYAIRVATPQWLDLRDELKAHAVALRGLKPITDAATARAAAQATYAARDDAWKARTAAIERLRQRIDAIDAIAASAAFRAAARAAALKFFTEGPGKAIRDSQRQAAAELVRAMAAVTDDAA